MRAAPTAPRIWCLLAVLSLAGCTSLDSLLSGDSNLLPGGQTDLPAGAAGEDEPNDQFSDATAVTVPSEGSLDLIGRISAESDIDVYDLGAVLPGDRLTVAVDNDLGVDLAAALFDDQGRLIAYNDDRWWQFDLRPRLAVTARHASEHCYLVVAASPVGSNGVGDYTATVLWEETIVPAPRPQTVYLNFAGAEGVTLPTRAPADIPPFDAANIDGSFAGRTSAMIDAIVQQVRADFARFNVQVLSSSEGPAPSGSITTVHFGLYDPGLLGLAESVDAYNADLTQQAIIFTDTFSIFMPLEPSLQDMAQAIANVASHEIGHLLGLEHTQDWTELMDTTAPAFALLDDQEFGLAPLYGQVFPIGQQDGALLIAEATGWSASASARGVDTAEGGGDTMSGSASVSATASNVAPSAAEPAGQVGAVSADVWRWLLYGPGSEPDHVSKEFFAVHFGGAGKH